MKMVIPQKQSNSGTIYDIASEHFDREINFGKAFEFAVIGPSYYGTIESRHKTVEAAEAKCRELSEYNGIRVFGRDGREWSFDGYELRDLGSDHNFEFVA